MKAQIDRQRASCSVSPPALPLSNKQALPVPVSSRQPRARGQFLASRPSAALERVLSTDTAPTQLPAWVAPCSASWLRPLAAAPFRFASLCVRGLCQGLVPFPSRARERGGNSAGAGFLKGMKRLPLPLADAPLRCSGSEPRAAAGHSWRPCTTAPSPVLPQGTFPGCLQELLCRSSGDTARWLELDSSEALEFGKKPVPELK